MGPESRTGLTRAVGEAFASVLLKCSERDFADTALLGSRLIDEFAQRGLVVTRASAMPARGDPQ